MPSSSEVSPLLSLNLRGPSEARELKPARDTANQEFRRLLEQPQSPPQNPRSKARSAPDARAGQERSVEAAQARAPARSSDHPANAQAPKSAVQAPKPAESQNNTTLPPDGYDGDIALAAPVELDLPNVVLDSTSLEDLLQGLLQWIEEEGLEVLDTEEGQEQLHALLSQLGLDVPEEHMPGLAAQIGAILRTHADQTQRGQAGDSELMARFKAALTPQQPNSGDLKMSRENAELDVSKLGDKLDFGQVMKASTKGEIDIQAMVKADGATPRGESTPMIQTLLGAEPGARGAQLQPGERSFVVQPEVRVPVGEPRWGQAVGERVLWLASQNIQSAELRLDPPDLGPVQVRVAIQNDQVTVTFTSNQIAVREALDQSAQRLRDMFSEQGLNLGDVNVSDQSEGREFAQGDQRGGRGDSDNPDDDLPPTPTRTMSLHLVDSYV
ncbi:flagellar hook-length control protein FliK [Marinimicrobium sp. ABcell2]|uniref:flagellar hook-length control protein FliK n=1 Tax=Marinimicrobium sp. ABcell2 TaxID=3069751 RepID=UPI0027B3B356|nr:flagellar hook-length control protein FliK [Marinimicrobium sp. ABcell2]MDQ2078089.1 flagellar hook-length control protein FliK [Marinimicrobium sp. ABcell2]